MSDKVPDKGRGVLDPALRVRFRTAVLQIFDGEPTNGELIALGHEAARAVGRSRPWGSRHLYTLLHFEKWPKYAINRELFDYVMKRAGVDVLNGAHKAAVVTKAKVREGALVLVPSRRCARRRCGIHFVPAVARQLYCSSECQQRVAAHRRKQRQLEMRRTKRHGRQ